LSKTPESETDENLQAAVVEFLSHANAYDADVASEIVEIIETHVSWVFLSGDRAYKLKRAVHFPYLDFSTLAAREAACEEEVRLNRRTAPDVYLGVVPVRREASGDMRLGSGEGEVVEWLVEMRRFEQDGLFDRLAQVDGLRRKRMEALADSIAAFHTGAEISSARGGAQGTRMIIENNHASFDLAPDGVFETNAVPTLTEASVAMATELAETLDARRTLGAVRLCHGDLHLRNICLIDDKPTLFDAIEFNRDFSEIDVLYDLAFLLMDLDYRGLGRLSSIVFNRYFDVTGELMARPGALSLLPLFLSMRAAIRSHVDALQAGLLSDEDKRRQRADEARLYLGMAQDYLVRPAPRLVAVGGLSGSGKSRMSRELAPYIGASPGARVVRTDVIRKRLWGVAPEVRLPNRAYSGEMHSKTYEAFYDEIREALAQGHSVIADGVFASSEQRNAVRQSAAEAGVPFTGIWMQATPEIMEQRVINRRHNASDATVDVLHQQLQYVLGDIDWNIVDSSGEKTATLAAGRHVLRQKT
jgi:uncharacterized protein